MYSGKLEPAYPHLTKPVPLSHTITLFPRASVAMAACVRAWRRGALRACGPPGGGGNAAGSVLGLLSYATVPNTVARCNGEF